MKKYILAFILTLGFTFFAYGEETGIFNIPEELKTEMTGNSYNENGPIKMNELVLVKVKYVNFNDEEKIAKISTAQDVWKRKIKLLAQEHPDEVKILSEDKYILIADVPKKYIKVRPPRFVSEEQRLAAAERLKSYRKNKEED